MIHATSSISKSFISSSIFSTSVCRRSMSWRSCADHPFFTLKFKIPRPTRAAFKITKIYMIDFHTPSSPKTGRFKSSSSPEIRRWWTGKIPHSHKRLSWNHDHWVMHDSMLNKLIKYEHYLTNQHSILLIDSKLNFYFKNQVSL